jgi:hypothetical protein
VRARDIFFPPAPRVASPRGKALAHVGGKSGKATAPSSFSFLFFSFLFFFARSLAPHLFAP